MKNFVPGQRWISETEPEMGLGTVLKRSGSAVTVVFSATGDVRNYAVESAPLRRALFKEGDTISTDSGESLTVDQVEEKNDLFFYLCGEKIVPESDLSDHLTFNKPDERLMNGEVDSNRVFDMRYRFRKMENEIRKSPVHGFTGARIDLIPHQLFIASEVCSRPFVRALFADEVGLGKTIEACLVMHRMMASGRCGRALVVVPEVLIHQWFVELMRRFNQQVTIFDEERWQAEAAQGDNPFFCSQQILCSPEFLLTNPARTMLCLNGEWDLIVVDEAHHLYWSKEAPSPEYELVAELGKRVPHMLLLTATPEQLGPESHFARLKLLDPDKYYDYNEFLEESGFYRKTAETADRLINRKALRKSDIQLLNTIFSHEEKMLVSRLERLEKENMSAADEILNGLLDQHGPGRVMFRNTRSKMEGFPGRKVHFYSLTGEAADLDNCLKEFEEDQSGLYTGGRDGLKNDPRIFKLAELLGKLKKEKALLICRSKGKAMAIQEALLGLINVKSTLFHEDLPLIQRDRNAAWFSEKDGAQILICSEIGSEGRNFQFAHHLVLFDIPLDPELLEQRIGRLDRIGQTQTIHLHVPFLSASPQEAVALWYHKGLGAFERIIEEGETVRIRFGENLINIARFYSENQEEQGPQCLSRLIEETAEFHKIQSDLLEKGRDRLLEMNSFRQEKADAIINMISKADEDRTLQHLMLEAFEFFGVTVEDMGGDYYLLKPDHMFTDVFPVMPSEGLTVTFHRKKALAREDAVFLSWDHPTVHGVINLMAGGNYGNSGFGFIESPHKAALLLEAVFVVDCIAPGKLHADRFMPPVPLHFVIDHGMDDLTKDCRGKEFAESIRDCRPHLLLDKPKVCKLIPQMLSCVNKRANKEKQKISKTSLSEMHRFYESEIERLEELRKINPTVSEKEIEAFRSEQSSLEKCLSEPSLTLDSVRVIWMGPSLEG